MRLEAEYQWKGDFRKFTMEYIKIYYETNLWIETRVHGEEKEDFKTTEIKELDQIVKLDIAYERLAFMIEKDNPMQRNLQDAHLKNTSQVIHFLEGKKNQKKPFYIMLLILLMLQKK